MYRSGILPARHPEASLKCSQLNANGSTNLVRPRTP
jgi:hypothetical protein